MISVIVPVFNAEKYLAKCIESVLGQTYKEWELILVNDGSIDRSRTICEEYAKRDRRIKVITQDNQGSSAARNKGLMVASGEYVSFLDCDDFIDNDMLEIMGNELSNKPDIIIAGMCKDFFTDEVLRRQEKISSVLDSGIYQDEKIDFLRKMMLFSGSFYEPGIIPSMCAKLFRTEMMRDVLENLPTGFRMGEDAVCTYLCVLKSKIIVILNEYFPYHYRQLSNSQSYRFDFDYFQKEDMLCNYLESFFEREKDRKYLLMQLDYYRLFLIFIGLDILFANRKQLKKAELMKQLQNANSILPLRAIEENILPSTNSRRLIELKKGAYLLLVLDYYLGFVRNCFKVT